MSPAALLVVGGGPAGLAACRGFRAAGGRGRVVLVTDEPHLPYRRPPLSKEHLRGELDPAELPLERASWYAEQDVEVRHVAATRLAPSTRTVTLEDGEELAYTACVLATGAEPVRPPVDGTGLPGVHVLRSRTESETLRAAALDGRRVAVVGSGFVGCEAAASLALHGCDVIQIAVEPLPQAERLGDEVGRRLAGWLTDAGVRLRGGAKLAGIAAAHQELVVAVEDGPPESVDLVLLAAGARPRTELAAAAGLTLGGGDAVACSAGQRTAAPGVYAAGDVAATAHPVAGRQLRVEHWGDALAQGEVAGRRAAGDGDAVRDAVPGFWSSVGRRSLKYVAWGDGHDGVRFDAAPGDEAFTAWYTRGGRTVGVLTHDRDADYERGGDLVKTGAPPP